MSDTQPRPRTVTASEIVQRMNLARASRQSVKRWRGTGRWQPLDACRECGYERREGRRVCSLCGASA